MTTLPALLEQYSNLILCLGEDENPDPLWQRFYQIQMASFILGNRNMDFELANALKAYNLICRKWEELEQELFDSAIQIKNFDNIFKQVFIDFS